MIPTISALSELLILQTCNNSAAFGTVPAIRSRAFSQLGVSWWCRVALLALIDGKPDDSNRKLDDPCYSMVWYGMVWYGMVWYGMVWYGMVWYGMVWYGMVWYGTMMPYLVVASTVPLLRLCILVPLEAVAAHVGSQLQRVWRGRVFGDLNHLVHGVRDVRVVCPPGGTMMGLIRWYHALDGVLNLEQSSAMPPVIVMHGDITTAL